MTRNPAAKRWADLIDRQEASGLTIRAFAEKADVNPRPSPSGGVSSVGRRNARRARSSRSTWPSLPQNTVRTIRPSC